MTYAWCFSHGCLHAFDGKPWCTATLAPLSASSS